MSWIYCTAFLLKAERTDLASPPYKPRSEKKARYPQKKKKPPNLAA
ncbi:hypothetical protein [Microcoleus vaginatus]